MPPGLMLDQNDRQDHRRARRAPGSLAFPSVRASARHDGRRLHQCGIQDSEALVQAGAPLVEIGDPLNLEVIADLLSADATQIAALGIEEQRSVSRSVTAACETRRRLLDRPALRALPATPYIFAEWRIRRVSR